MYRWLDYILSAKANAGSARYLGEAPATPAACAYMSCTRRARGRRGVVVAALVLAARRSTTATTARGGVRADWFGWSDAWALIRSG